MISSVLFDVDGTLVDSNDAHARAWVDGFEEAGIRVSYDEVRRAIGMGGDKLMPSVAGLSEDSPEGARIAARRRDIFKEKYLPHIRPLPGASELVMTLKRRGPTLVAASSAKQDELTPLLRIAGVDGLLDAATSSDDAEESKPAEGKFGRAADRVLHAGFRSTRIRCRQPAVGRGQPPSFQRLAKPSGLSR